MDKWEVLSERMKQEMEGTFLVSRIEPDSLRAAYAAGRGVITELAGEIVACGFIWETPDPKVFEPGSLWVIPEDRGHGDASTIFRLRLRLVPKGKYCFIITHEPRVAHLCLKNGFVEATRATWFNQVPNTCTCGPCDRVAEAEKLACPFRAKEKDCRLFVLAPK